MFSYETGKLDFWIHFKHSGGGTVAILHSKMEGFTDTSVFTTSGHEFKDLVDVDKTMVIVDKQVEEYLTKKQ